MNYALIIVGAVAQYPYSFWQLRKDNPDVSFPRDPSDERLADFGMIALATGTPPAHDPITQNIVEGTPALVVGVWTQVWNVVAASAEEIAARQQNAAVEGELSAAKLDAWIVSYLAMTPSAAEQYVLNNSANLAQLRSVTSKMAYALRVLIRREFNV